MVLFRTCSLISKTIRLLNIFLFKQYFSIGSEHATVGFFWMNAAEGWIDVNNDKLNVQVSP